MPKSGVVFIPSLMPIGQAVTMLGTLVETTGDFEWANLVHFLTVSDR
jgi:hypothetical protein